MDGFVVRLGGELALAWELEHGEAHGFFCYVDGDAVHFKEDPARLDDGNPALDRGLTLAHTGFERLLRVALVGEDPNPDLATTLDVAGHGDSGGLDLAGCDPI